MNGGLLQNGRCTPAGDEVLPTKDFHFPKHTFGNKGEERSFQGYWCAKFPWLYYVVGKDIDLCHVYMQCCMILSGQAMYQHLCIALELENFPVHSNVYLLSYPVLVL